MKRGAERKVIHKAKHVAPNGDVSPICATEPKALDLQLEGWTLTDRFVNCRRCLHVMKHEGEAAA